MKADMEALKEQMITMMEVMMSMKKIMEVNVAAVAATSTVAEVEPTPPFGLNQINHLTSDRVGQGSKELGGTSSYLYVQIQTLCSNSKHACFLAIWLTSQLCTT